MDLKDFFPFSACKIYRAAIENSHLNQLQERFLSHKFVTQRTGYCKVYLATATCHTM